MQQILYHGLDELVIQQRFSFPAAPPPPRPRLTLRDVLSLVGPAATDRLGAASCDWVPGRTCFKAALPHGDLRVGAVCGRVLAQFFADQRELHVDPAATQAAGLRALALVKEVVPDLVPMGLPHVHKLTLFADVSGLPLSPGIEKNVAYRGRGRRMYSQHGAMTLQFGRASLYDKSAEIKIRKRKAWIRPFWGSHRADRVTRIEVRCGPKEVARLEAGDLRALWNHGLTYMSLREGVQPGGESVPRARRPEVDLWRRLRMLTFDHMPLAETRVAEIRDGKLIDLTRAMKLMLRNLAVCLVRRRGSPQTTTRILTPFAELLGADLANVEAQIAEYRRIYEGRFSPQDPEAPKGGVAKIF